MHHSKRDKLDTLGALEEGFSLCLPCPKAIVVEYLNRIFSYDF